LEVVNTNNQGVVHWLCWSGPLEIKFAWSGPWTETSLTPLLYSEKERLFRTTLVVWKNATIYQL